MLHMNEKFLVKVYNSCKIDRIFSLDSSYLVFEKFPSISRDLIRTSFIYSKIPVKNELQDGPKLYKNMIYCEFLEMLCRVAI